MDWLAYETKAALAGYKSVCGIDEAGRGPLAGPVFAAAVILPEGLLIEGVNDSKKLSPKKREKLYEDITRNAVSWAVASADEKEIDEFNILQATFLAMRRAVGQLSVRPDLCLVDGSLLPGLDIRSKALVGGDALSASIACASILAKVSRDRYMQALALEYPQYAFEKHKGYGTPLHYSLIERYGVSPVHRVSFLKKLNPMPGGGGQPAQK
ncbi:MAG: Ribonuclease HII [Firmicutes bacterium ADurb.Bin262]|nr:MAG: Ribonuclease HII [Firmicutes bacterium ADurb.Bin262]